MAQWYWMKGEQKRGPVDTGELRRLARTGELKPTDAIWRDGLPNWVPASQTKGLFTGPNVISPISGKPAPPVMQAATPNVNSSDRDMQPGHLGMVFIFTCLLSPLSFGVPFLVAGIADWVGVSKELYMALPISVLGVCFLFLCSIGFTLARRLQRSGIKWALLALASVGITTAGLTLWWLHQSESGATRKLRLRAWAAIGVSIVVIALIGHGLEELEKRPLPLIHYPGPGPQLTQKCGKCGREVSILYKVGDRCPHCGVIWTREDKE